MSTEFENKFYERHKMSFLRWLMLNCGDLGPCPFCGLERKIKDDWAHLRIQPIFRFTGDGEGLVCHVSFVDLTRVDSVHGDPLPVEDGAHPFVIESDIKFLYDEFKERKEALS